MLHALRELAVWRSAHARAGITALDQITDQTLNGTNLAVLIWDRIVIYFAAADLYAGNRDISATDQGLDRALEKDTAADEARRVALAAVADLRSLAAPNDGATGSADRSQPRQPDLMALTATALEGETVGEVCWRVLGTTRSVVEQVLEGNPGWPIWGRACRGTPVILPASAAATRAPTLETISLWD
jgi:phage tail protein X